MAYRKTNFVRGWVGGSSSFTRLVGLTA